VKSLPFDGKNHDEAKKGLDVGVNDLLYSLLERAERECFLLIERNE
jgi:hypothetical protein